MTQDATMTEVYLEVSEKRAFAVALDWPGWCRSGRDDASALQTLYEYGPRYARVLETTSLGFCVPSEASELVVVEQVTGDATTDFGAPSIELSRDAQPVEPDELARWQEVLEACWQAFDAAVEAARGHTLRKGPRGGGRELSKIVGHVRDVDAAYLKSLGGTMKVDRDADPDQVLAELREAILTTLVAAVRGEVPARGPRGGVRWTPRYFVRRLAWHELDHVWEIEDRVE